MPPPLACLPRCCSTARCSWAAPAVHDAPGRASFSNECWRRPVLLRRTADGGLGFAGNGGDIWSSKPAARSNQTSHDGMHDGREGTGRGQRLSFRRGWRPAVRRWPTHDITPTGVPPPRWAPSPVQKQKNLKSGGAPSPKFHGLLLASGSIHGTRRRLVVGASCMVSVREPVSGPHLSPG